MLGVVGRTNLGVAAFGYSLFAVRRVLPRFELVCTIRPALACFPLSVDGPISTGSQLSTETSRATQEEPLTVDRLTVDASDFPLVDHVREGRSRVCGNLHAYGTGNLKSFHFSFQCPSQPSCDCEAIGDTNHASVPCPSQLWLSCAAVHARLSGREP